MGINNVLECQIAYNKYGSYCIPRSSDYRTSSRMIMHGDVYEPDTLGYILNHYNGGDIIHAGAYFGDFIPALSNLLNYRGLLWTFEPHPVNFECLEITKMINQIKNVKSFECALGDDNSKVNLKVCGENNKPLGDLCQIVSEKNTQTIEVQQKKLDSIIPTHRKISIIHLDVEGHEEEVLKGACETIRNNKPILVLESTPQNWIDENFDYVLDREVHQNKVLIPN